MSNIKKATIFTGILGLTIGCLTHRAAVKYHRDGETGTIIGKANYEILVDTNGDSQADRILDFSPCFDDGMAYYNYAQPGHKVSYSNVFGADVIYVYGGMDAIRSVDGKSARKIRQLYKKSVLNNQRVR